MHQCSDRSREKPFEEDRVDSQLVGNLEGGICSVQFVVLRMPPLLSHLITTCHEKKQLPHSERLPTRSCEEVREPDRSPVVNGSQEKPISPTATKCWSTNTCQDKNFTHYPFLIDGLFLPSWSSMIFNQRRGNKGCVTILSC